MVSATLLFLFSRALCWFHGLSSRGSLERTLILKGGFLILKGGISKDHLMWAGCFLLLRGCFSSVPAWSQGCVFVWSQSRFIGHSCTLGSLGYFNYRNYHALGPFGLTGLLSFLLGPSCVCLHRKCTLNMLAVSASFQTARGGGGGGDGGVEGSGLLKVSRRKGDKEGKESTSLESNQEFCWEQIWKREGYFLLFLETFFLC